MIYPLPPSVDMVFFAFVLLEKIPISAKGLVAWHIDYLKVAHKPLGVLGKKMNI